MANRRAIVLANGIARQIPSGDALEADLLILNGSRYSISNTAPVSPAVGDLWLETDAAKKPLYGWDWWWDGSFWRSPEREIRSSGYGLSTSPSYYMIAADSTFSGYYFSRWAVTSNVITTNNSGNYWAITPHYLTSTGGQGNIATPITTANDAASTYVEKKSAINTSINLALTSAKNFAIAFTKAAGAPGNMNAGAVLYYSFLR